MNKTSTILSASGLKNVHINHETEEDFVFIFGKEELKMNNIYAEFISPRVSHIHQIDPTITTINFSSSLNQIEKMRKTNEKKEIINNSNLQKLQEISQGSNIELETIEDIEQFRIISILLMNYELYELIDKYDNTNISKESNEASKVKQPEKFLDEIELFYHLMPNFDINKYVKHLDYISEHFWSIEGDRLAQTPSNIIYSIISNEHFEHDSESDDKLVDLLNKIIDFENEEDINRFYEKVDLNNLSENKLKEFLDNYDINSITQEMWTKIKGIIIDKHSNTKSNKKGEIKFEYNGDSSQQFKGIISYLAGTENKNVSDEGIVDVTSKSSEQGGHLLKNVVDFNSNEYYLSYYGGEEWIKYDFKERKVNLTCYSIKT